MGLDNRVVLVIADDEDTSADAVVEELERRPVGVARLNTANFPQRVGLTASFGCPKPTIRLCWGDRELDVTTVRSIYRRSPAAFELAEGMSAVERRFAMSEAVQGLGGGLASLDCRWVNHPARVADATYKPHQLRVAAACGLRVPRTLITNRADAAAGFAAGCAHGIVYKPMANGMFTEEGEFKVINTQRLAAADLDEASIGRTACQFQEWVPKAFDVRLTVVGEQFFAVAIDAGSKESYVDWRADYTALSYRIVPVPPAVRQGVTAYLGTFDLAYAALDFGVTADGAWWFYEANPNGQWEWIAEATGAPIAAALADHLAEENP